MKMIRTHSPALGLALALTLGSGVGAAQLTATWTGNGDGVNWSDAANWTSVSAPDNGTPAGTTYRVVIPAGKDVTLDTFAVIDSLTVGGVATLTILNSKQLDVVNSGAGTGTIVNSGTISLNSLGTSTDLAIHGNVILSGGGTISFSDNINNRIFGTASTDRLNNIDNTIQGAGQIGANFMALTNQGTIRATFSIRLTIDPSASGAANTGTLTAIGGGTLRLQDGNFTNSDAVISAAKLSQVELSGATVSGGALATSGNGVIRNTGVCTLTNLKNTGNFQANNGTDTNLVGTIDNSGTIGLNSSGTSTDLIVNGSVTLKGGGYISFSDNVNNRIFDVASTDRLTNQDNFIQGAGQIGVDFMALTNNGTITASQTNTLSLDPGPGGFLNSGTFEADGGTLRLQSGDFSNTSGGIVMAWSPYEVQLTSAATITGGSLVTQGSGVIRNTGVATLANLTNSGSFAANNGTDTNLTGTITNNGTIALNSGGTSTDLIIGGNVILGGTGAVVLGNNINNRIFGLAASDRLNNGPGHTIRGAGQIGADFMALTNQGTILADFSNKLSIDPSTTGAINTGALRATGGTLRLQDGNFSNTGGTLSATGASSLVELTGVTVTGGNLTTTAPGVIRNVGVITLASLTNSGSFEAANGTDTNLTGTITDNGTISVLSAGTSTDIIINGNVTLGGTGAVVLGDNINNRIFGIASTHRLTHAAGHTIRGAGQIGADFMNFTNQGVIVADASNALTVNPTSDFTTTGTVRVESGRTLAMGSGDVFTQTAGLTTVNGNLTLDGANMIVAGGTLAGKGTVTGNVVNSATVSPGNPVGILSIAGDYTQSAAGSLRVEIAGPGIFDKLAVSLTASLAGTVDVVVIPPYSPSPGAGFGIVSYTARAGTLALGTIDSARGDRFTRSTAQFSITLNALGPSFGTGPSTVTRLPGGSANATFPGVSGLNYRVEKSDTLAPGGWSTAATLPAGPGGIVTFTDPAPLPSKRFYRIAFP